MQMFYSNYADEISNSSGCFFNRGEKKLKQEYQQIKIVDKTALFILTGIKKRSISV